ncbi:MAG: MoCo/4Fe-4S cofactor protein with predicted Tat translocation signal [Phycisphaerales bacterium]|jgi:MoCo/4Fe-4S cofactor protein with predicted Tat translocation signal
MSHQDQCPSTNGKTPIPEVAAPLGTLSGQHYWRSLDEYAGTPEFKDFVEREFPVGASELMGNSRRDFIKVMGAGLAIAGAATIPGCRRPERKIYPYSQTVPEEIIPGMPLYYATAMAIPGGGAEGLLVETHVGRPTHVEGNPLHPTNRGKSSVHSKAFILDMYDPDRLKGVTVKVGDENRSASWDDFTQRAQGLAGLHTAHDADRGAGLAFIVDKKTSPTRDAMRDAVTARWPNATWVAWNPAETRGAIDGSAIAFGSPKRTQLDLSKANCVLSLDSDFTTEGPDALVNARNFASTRRVTDGHSQMSRLYVAESRPTATGSTADHRFRMAPSRITALAFAVAKAVGASSAAGISAASLTGDDLKHAAAIAADLVANRGHAIVLAGPTQPDAVHALAHEINAALDANDSIVSFTDMPAEQASDSAADLTALTSRMASGQIRTLVCLGTNPVYDHPAGIGFAAAWDRVPETISLSVGSNETAAAAKWSLNGAHQLESWGDAEAHDGTLSAVQPMIAPLYAPAMSEIEFLALLAGSSHGGADTPDGFTIVSSVWASRLSLDAASDRFLTRWRRALHDGLLAGSASPATATTVNTQAVASSIASLTLAPAPTTDSLEVVFHTGHIGDGRYANNGWLQELPEIGTTVVWDNPVCLSPNTARTLKLLPPTSAGKDDTNPYTGAQMPQAKLATMTIGGHDTEVAVWILPGMPDNVAAVMLGFGHDSVGRVGDQVGHNTYKVRSGNAAITSGATLAATGKTQTVASTQNHWSMESRTTIVRAMDKKWFDQHAGHPKSIKDEIYGTTPAVPLNVAEQMGELSHTPANISIYRNPQNDSHEDAAPGSTFSKGPQWGMTIDLNTCTGCNVCTVACQSENNIPIVGKSEVAKGRELAWIRVDRYFVGDDLNDPTEVLMQPVACVHCENAPCESVCPVNATVHGPEGTNNMAYNRCIGTRYCANNCPYKVRRFNFFDWGQSKFNGGLDPAYVPQPARDAFDDGPGADRTFNQNFIPPRLRAKLDEISKMRQNPDVTIRSRGVMEKCSYCIQRINAARAEVKLRDIWTDAEQVGPIPDGFFQTACQQACPTESIVFGDILDPASRVKQSRDGDRAYMLLGYLDTRPRTSHLMRVRNPNPEVWEYDEHDPLDHSQGGESPEGGETDSHGSEGDDHAAAAFIDTTKRYTDQGYNLSLRVLGGTLA